MKEVNDMKGKRFKPVTGTVYTNKGGGTFLCDDVWENDTPSLSYYARMTNTKSGWTFIAHGLVQYEDGAIEWDYSTGGRWGEVPA